MPRRARLSIPGIPWHIIQRGNNRSVCFYAEEDFQFYLHFLQEFAVKFGCDIHAYVLMTNHVHQELGSGLALTHFPATVPPYGATTKNRIIWRHLPGIYHVTSRGDGREDIYLS